eukprot:TRINITY_DN8972_c0_g1_i4.p3 TRINITY_DN8972_c0_g1~~TRINITY_DN8972_c0_g1_i4.p3  ORF type:complete len:102 (+),score=2.30 TRINITY_DN8972_c0_g1_i4:127-432(+)
MIRRPPRSTQGVSSAASDVYKRQVQGTPPAFTLSQDQTLHPIYFICLHCRQNKLFQVFPVYSVIMVRTCLSSHYHLVWFLRFGDLFKSPRTQIISARYNSR